MDSDEFVLCDVFPAEVYTSEQKMLVGARVFLTNQRFIAWRVVDGIPRVVFEFPITEYQGEIDGVYLKPNSRLEVFGLTKHAIVNKGRGCGCDKNGLKLKALPSPAPRKVNV